MALAAVTITHRDRAWQDAFIDFVPRVFTSVDFRRWRDAGGWDERYVAYALAEGDRIVASTSVTQLQLVIAGQIKRGYQLGAVATLDAHRGRGLQRSIMARACASMREDDIVLLFANEDVLEFYPRFGFERAAEVVFRAPYAIDPAGRKLRRLERSNAADRALLARIAANAVPTTERFGARDYGAIALWYFCNFYPHVFHHADEHDAIVAVQQQDGLLQFLDVLAAAPFDLAEVIPRVIDAPVSELEFRFTPERYWPSAAPAYACTDDYLFVRGPYATPETPFKFPALAQT